MMRREQNLLKSLFFILLVFPSCYNQSIHTTNACERAEARKMQLLWVSLKESMNCGTNVNDVICLPNIPMKQSHYSNEEAEQMHGGQTDDINVMGNIASRERTASLSSFKEVGTRELSRKVIENILGDALTYPTKKILKITRVLRVRNTHEVVQKFEKYRDLVKQKAKEREQMHPRSLVDGNERLCFYVTTMTCHSKQSKGITEPCGYSDCNLCRIVGSNFIIICPRGFAVQLSMNTAALRERIAEVSKRKNSKKVVIICRIIAGRTKSTKDVTSEDGYDSIMNEGFYPKSEHLIVINPDAILPCFVILLN